VKEDPEAYREYKEMFDKLYALEEEIIEFE
jgi:hypothetical protein